MDPEPVITSIILSDGAITEQGTGKVSMIGCFNSIAVPKFPHVHPGFFANIGITNLPPGGSKIALTIRVEVESTGHVLGSAGGDIEFGAPTPGDVPFDLRKMVVDIPIRFGPVVFPQPGPYSIVVLVNNERLLARNLILQLPTVASQATQNPPA